MRKINNLKNNENQSAEKPDPPFSSNHIRLSPAEWLMAIVIIMAMGYFAQVSWIKIEHFNYIEDYRLPFQLSNDYWLYNRLCKTVCRNKDSLVVGDSVVWGQYVERGQTLSHYLSEFSGSRQFVNMGLDGLHPIAAYGLLKYYGNNITKKNIILHFNPLWLSSPKYDLQTDKEFNFNHPEIVPQFFPRIPCYYASISKKTQIIFHRNIAFLGWVKHLQSLCLQNGGSGVSFPEWFLAHPFKNPFQDITVKLQNYSAESDHKNPDVRSNDTNIKYDLPWVEIESSLQWKYFTKTVKLLQKRKNNVFVLVGPFNEHTLNERSLITYSRIKSDIEKWLINNNVNYYIPPPLPESFYADVSHPTSQGYALLAEELIKKAYK